MRILLIRHGQSTFNASFDQTRKDPQIRDAQLTKLGREQAVVLGRRVLADVRPDTVLTSPLTRAVETATLAFPLMSLEVTSLCREGLFSSCDVGRPPHLLAAEFPKLDWTALGHHWWLDRGRTAETRTTEEALRDRVFEFLRFLEQRRERVLAVVSHGAFLHRMTGVDFGNCEWRTYPIDELREAVLDRYSPNRAGTGVGGGL